jgi:sulfite reductase beta subunit-like hemoprotein
MRSRRAAIAFGNTTTDPLAGVARDEIVDPRPWAELVRQWSTIHPDFACPAAQVQDRDHRARPSIAPLPSSTTSAAQAVRDTVARSDSACSWAAARAHSQ